MHLLRSAFSVFKRAHSTLARACLIGNVNRQKIMRFLPLLVAMIVSASLQAEQKKSVRDSIGTKLKDEFHFDPSFRANETQTPDDELLVLEKITVTKSVKWGLFEKTMVQKHKEQLKEETFTLADGGPFASKDFGKIRAQIGIWGEGGGLTFLKFRW